jgi:hypothetical protein
MKYFLLFPFIFLSLFNDAFSQQENKSGGIAIKVSPLTLLEPNFPAGASAKSIQRTRLFFPRWCKGFPCTFII